MPKRWSRLWARFHRRRQAAVVLFSALFLVYFYGVSKGPHLLFWSGGSKKTPSFNWAAYEFNSSVTYPCPSPDYASINFHLSDQAAENITGEFVGRNSAGHWRPSECIPNTSVVIIVPFRQRHRHLKQFLPYMHKFLQGQLLDYAIVVVQQPEGGTFNKARIMNAAFLELKKQRRFDCYIFHDVDLLPLDRRLSYRCSEKGPLHMATAIDKFRYKLPYEDNFGGVTAFTSDQFEAVNGFSNRYYGWGAEDDDIYQRVRLSGQKVQRPPLEIAHYKSFRHAKDPGNPRNPKKDELNRETKNVWRLDGLNSLNYTVLAVVNEQLYLNITVDVGGLP